MYTVLHLRYMEEKNHELNCLHFILKWKFLIHCNKPSFQYFGPLSILSYGVIENKKTKQQKKIFHVESFKISAYDIVRTEVEM